MDGNPLWYSCLDNPIDRGAWRSIVCGVTKSRTQLGDRTTTKKEKKMALSLLRTTSVTIFWLHVTETLTQTATSKMELIYSCQQKFQKSPGFRHGWIQKPDKVTMDLPLYLLTLSPGNLAVITRCRCQKPSKSLVLSTVNPLSRNNSKKPQRKSQGISLVVLGSQAYP